MQALGLFKKSCGFLLFIEVIIFTLTKYIPQPYYSNSGPVNAKHFTSKLIFMFLIAIISSLYVQLLDPIVAFCLFTILVLPSALDFDREINKLHIIHRQLGVVELNAISTSVSGPISDQYLLDQSNNSELAAIVKGIHGKYFLYFFLVKSFLATLWLFCCASFNLILNAHEDKAAALKMIKVPGSTMALMIALYGLVFIFNPLVRTSINFYQTAKRIPAKLELLVVMLIMGFMSMWLFTPTIGFYLLYVLSLPPMLEFVSHSCKNFLKRRILATPAVPI